MMLRAVQSVGTAVLVALAVLASAVSWAQQKPGAATTTQSAPTQSCTPQKMTQCAEQAKSACGADATCIRQTTNTCLGGCDHP
jgi:hypothetical protein